MEEKYIQDKIFASNLAKEVREKLHDGIKTCVTFLSGLPYEELHEYKNDSPMTTYGKEEMISLLEMWLANIKDKLTGQSHRVEEVLDSKVEGEENT